MEQSDFVDPSWWTSFCPGLQMVTTEKGKNTHTLTMSGKTIVNVAGMFPFGDTGFASVGPIIYPFYGE